MKLLQHRVVRDVNFLANLTFAPRIFVSILQILHALKSIRSQIVTLMLLFVLQILISTKDAPLNG